MKHNGRDSECFPGIVKVVNTLRVYSMSLIACIILLNFISCGDAFSFNSGSFPARKTRSSHNHMIHTLQIRKPCSFSIKMCIDRDVNQELQDLGRFQGEQSDRDNRWRTGNELK